MSRAVSDIVTKYNREQGYVVSILQDIMEEDRYLSPEALEQVSQELKMPRSQVYAVATFYKTLSLKPRGKHMVQVCTGTACHVRGATRIVEKLERDLKVRRGFTTPDMKYTLEEVRCVGACAMGPVVIVNKEYYGNVELDKVGKIIEKYE